MLCDACPPCVVPPTTPTAGLWLYQLRGTRAGGLSGAGPEWWVAFERGASHCALQRRGLTESRCTKTSALHAGKDVNCKELYVGRAQKKAEREAMLRAK